VNHFSRRRLLAAALIGIAALLSWTARSLLSNPLNRSDDVVLRWAKEASEMKAFDRAGRLYEIVADRNPLNPSISYDARRGAIEARLSGNGDREEALKAYGALLAGSGLNPGQTAVLHDDIAKLDLQLGRKEDAAKHFRLILDKYPQDDWSTYEARCGLIDLRLKPEEARTAYQRLLERYKDSPAIVSNLRSRMAARP
jgi:tetratricopeptide (TPR) repeat protein